MIKKVIGLLFVCMIAVTGLGCGGEGSKVEVSNQMAPLEQNPGLQEAVRAEAAGEYLSGSQQRILKDAREEGIIE